MAEAAYYELSWAILSTIGITNVLFGLMVIGIATPTAISILPVVVSAACAIANGMCYYAFYADYPLPGTLVASAVADLTWLIQEAGLSFYSYIILIRVLRSRSRTFFMVGFWGLMVIIAALRVAIMATRIRSLLDESRAEPLQTIVNHLHMAYFICIALLEIMSSIFLLRKFAAARRFSTNAAHRDGLFSYLMRSTEVRMAFLAVIGTTRAVTYSFQMTAQSATGIAGQFDRFAYTLECVFPIIMFIDILASKLAFANDIYAGVSSRNKNPAPRHFTQQGTVNNEMYPLPDVERRIDIIAGGPVPSRNTNHRTSSQEHIVPGDSDDATASSHDGGSSPKNATVVEDMELGINKTVEFAMYETQHRR